MRRPKMLAVTCPTCNAPPGQHCMVNWLDKPDVHPKRITLADRAYSR